MLISTNKKPRVICLLFLIVKKAFDTVWRLALLHKLLDKGIGGNFYIRIIEHVYSSTVCAVKQSNVHSDFFATNREDCSRSRELKIAFTTYIFRG